MRATVMFGAGDVRIENVPDARIVEPTDALLRVTRACICGSDLWPYNQLEPSEAGQRMGHEFIGVVEAVGADVRTVKPGDVVVAPFAYSDGTCIFCHEGLQTSCLHGGWWARDGIDGGQGEAVRVPRADGTLVVLPVGEDDALIPGAYLLAFGGLLLLGARAGDVLGRRRVFITGVGLFAFASLAVGLAQSPAWLLAGRAFQGAHPALPLCVLEICANRANDCADSLWPSGSEAVLACAENVRKCAGESRSRQRCPAALG